MLEDKLCPDGIEVSGAKRNVPHCGTQPEMKTTELIKFIRWALKVRDRLPLSEAELRLDTGLHQSVLAYEDEVRLGHPARERRCMICELPISKCCC